jgi:26S proteasome regulatory subunit N2
MRSIVGLAIFLQNWYWYPYLHFLTLSFEPSCVIGLNKSLKMPVFSFKSKNK